LIPSFNGNRRPEDQLHQQCQIPDYQNKDKLSASRMLLVQRKPKLGRKNPSTGPHAAHGPRVGHSWNRSLFIQRDLSFSTLAPYHPRG